MKNLGVFAIAALSALALSTASQAAETVIGGGLAQDCYEAAEHSNAPGPSIEICNKALESIMLQRDRAATLINRGILKLALKDGTGSLADFDRGLSLNSGMGEGFVNRGASLIMLHRYSEALTDINKGMSLGTKKVWIAYYDRGMANEALGNIQAAYQDYKQATIIDPYFEEPANELKRFHVVTKPAT